MGDNNYNVPIIMVRADISERRRKAGAEGPVSLFPWDWRPHWAVLEAAPDLWILHLDFAPDEAGKNTDIVLA
jgi:hypothetical protein